MKSTSILLVLILWGLTARRLDGNTDNKSPGVIQIFGMNIFTAFGDQLIMCGMNEMFIWSEDLTGEKRMQDNKIERI